MRYLLYGALALFLTAGTVAAQQHDEDYHGLSYNDDVNRKFQLDANGVIEIVTDIRFKPKSQDEARVYYYVIPHTHEDNLVSLSAVVSTSQNDATVKRVDVSSLPADIKKTLAAKNATNEVSVFKFSTHKDESSNNQITYTVKELYKRRKEPFPSKIQIRDEQYVKFYDSKYFVTVYPTKNQKSTFTHNSANLL